MLFSSVHGRKTLSLLLLLPLLLLHAISQTLWWPETSHGALITLFAKCLWMDTQIARQGGGGGTGGTSCDVRANLTRRYSGSGKSNSHLSLLNTDSAK